MSELKLLVGGSKYRGWKGIRVVRSIERLAGSFELDVNDRWGSMSSPWAILEEDACRIEIDGVVVITGHIDRRSITVEGQSRTLAYGGRDRSAALVDCAALLPKWSYAKTSIVELTKLLAAPFAVPVTVDPSVTLAAPLPKIVINPGEKAFQVIERIAALAGVVVVSDARGGIVITRAGTARADVELIQGGNVKTAKVERDASDRFRRYVVLSQISGTDEASGAQTQTAGEAVDEGVRRVERVHVIRPSTGVTAEYARQRADWEARVRAARASSVIVTVRGWLQREGGALWPLNAIVSTHLPMIGVSGELLISEITHSLGEGGGETTQLRLIRPDGLEPEPRAKVRAGGAIEELREGV